jgi:hypothetical protein
MLYTSAFDLQSFVNPLGALKVHPMGVAPELWVDFERINSKVFFYDFLKMIFQNSPVMTSVCILFGLESIWSVTSWSPATQNREPLAGRHSVVYFNASADWTCALVTAFGLLPYRPIFPFCRGIFIVYMLQVLLLQKISKNLGGTPNVCAQWVSSH